jgi:hypothetical protein
VVRRSAQQLFALAALTVVLAIAGCGGSGGSSTSGGTSEESQIKDAISTSVTSTDPADCVKLETLTFMEQIHFTSGQAAIRACQHDAPDTSDDPDSVTITNVVVHGANATADVTFHGGGFDGSTLAMALVKQGGQWKLDQITAIPSFDLARFEAAFTQRLTRDQQAPAAAVQCIRGQLNQAGADAVKSALISGDSSQLLNLIGPCISGEGTG